MNIKRLVLSCIAVFFFVFLYEWLFHGVLLKGVYEATQHLWRPHDEIKMGAMFGGQLLFSIIFCMIFTKGYEGKGVGEGVRYGVLITFIFIASNIMMYSVTPYPLSLVVQWTVGMLVELIIAGVIVASIYKTQTVAGSAAEDL